MRNTGRWRPASPRSRRRSQRGRGRSARSPGRARGCAGDEILERVARLLEGALGGAAFGDFTTELLVLGGDLLEHAVDRLAQHVELARAAVGRKAARGVTRGNGRCRARDLVHVGEQCAANEPASGDAKQKYRGGSAREAVPEEIDQGLKARALAADEKVVPVAELDVRADHAHLAAVAVVDRHARDAGRRRNLGWPGGKVAGNATVRRVGQHDHFVGALCRDAGADERRERLRTLLVENVPHGADVVAAHVGLRLGQVQPPRVPQWEREQHEHGHAQGDVRERELERREAECRFHDLRAGATPLCGCDGGKQLFAGERLRQHAIHAEPRGDRRGALQAVTKACREHDDGTRIRRARAAQEIVVAAGARQVDDEEAGHGKGAHRRPVRQRCHGIASILEPACDEVTHEVVGLDDDDHGRACVRWRHACIPRRDDGARVAGSGARCDN